MGKVKPTRSVSETEVLGKFCERDFNASVPQVCQRAQHTVIHGCYFSQSFNHHSPPFCSPLVSSCGVGPTGLVLGSRSRFTSRRKSAVQPVFWSRRLTKTRFNPFWS